MTALADFQQFVTDAQAGSMYAKWAHDNPGEVQRWTQFRDAVLAGGFPAYPPMTTAFGKELCDAGIIVEHYVHDTTPAPPAPPPPPVPSFSTNVLENEAIDVSATPFTWKFDPGVPATAGQFWADGKLLISIAGPGPYTHQIKSGDLPEGANTLGHSWDLADGTHHSPPAGFDVSIHNTVAPPPPPPVTVPTLIFNGLAANYLAHIAPRTENPYMAGLGSSVRSQVSDVDTTYFDPNSSDLAHQADWQYAGGTYMKWDCKVVDRAGFPGGKAWHVAPPSGDHNPYNTNPSPGTTSALMSRRDISKPGKWQFFGFAAEVVTFDHPGWLSMFNVNYETLQYDQCAIGWHDDGGTKWSIMQHAGHIIDGVLQKGPAGQDPNLANYYQSLKPVVAGQIEKWALVLKQATDAYDGEVQVWNAVGNGPWSMVFRKTGVPTYLWGDWTSGGYGPVSLADLNAGKGVLQKGNEVYCGYWDGHAPFPTADTYQSGWVEGASLADVQAALA